MNNHVGHFGDVPQANLLASYGKTKTNTTKAHIHQSKEMYYNTTARCTSHHTVPSHPFMLRLLGKLSLGQSSPKWEKLIPDSSRTSVRSFMRLSFSATEKSVTVQTNKQTHSKLSIPPY